MTKPILITIIQILCSTFLFSGGNPNPPAKGKAYFHNIEIPLVDLQNNTVLESLDFAYSRAHEMNTGVEYEQNGFKIQPIPKGYDKVLINLRLRNTTLRNLLKQYAIQAKLDLYVTSAGITFTKPGKLPSDNKTTPNIIIWDTIHKTTK